MSIATLLHRRAKNGGCSDEPSIEHCQKPLSAGNSTVAYVPQLRETMLRDNPHSVRCQSTFALRVDMPEMSSFGFRRIRMYIAVGSLGPEKNDRDSEIDVSKVGP
jgi:hypothetical protein